MERPSYLNHNLFDFLLGKNDDGVFFRKTNEL